MSKIFNKLFILVISFLLFSPIITHSKDITLDNIQEMQINIAYEHMNLSNLMNNLNSSIVVLQEYLTEDQLLNVLDGVDKIIMVDIPNFLADNEDALTVNNENRELFKRIREQIAQVIEIVSNLRNRIGTGAEEGVKEVFQVADLLGSFTQIFTSLNSIFGDLVSSVSNSFSIVRNLLTAATSGQTDVVRQIMQGLNGVIELISGSTDIFVELAQSIGNLSTIGMQVVGELTEAASGLGGAISSIGNTAMSIPARGVDILDALFGVIGSLNPIHR
jgi:methyl-accepting chemotaxis protein